MCHVLVPTVLSPGSICPPTSSARFARQFLSPGALIQKIACPLCLCWFAEFTPWRLWTSRRAVSQLRTFHLIFPRWPRVAKVPAGQPGGLFSPLSISQERDKLIEACETVLSIQFNCWTSKRSVYSTALFTTLPLMQERKLKRWQVSITKPTSLTKVYSVNWFKWQCLINVEVWWEECTNHFRSNKESCQHDKWSSIRVPPGEA